MVLFGIFNDQRLMYIFLTGLSIYYIFSLLFNTFKKGSGAKKLESLRWVESGDPTSFCKLRVNLDPLDKLLEEYNTANPKKRVTYTLFGLKSIGYAFS